VEPETGEALKRVHKLFKDNDLKLSIAESCTGGLVSHYVTTLAGASRFFTAGIVSYSEQIKINVLGVSPDVYLAHGVVSEEMAREMAGKVRLLAETDFSLSTTGNLGPDVLEGKEKGLIYIAASTEGRTVSKELRLRGTREENKEEAARLALELLIECVEDKQK